MDAIFLSLQQFSFGTVVSVVATLFLIDGYFKKAQRMQSSGLPLPIVIPGLPLIGNLLQLKEKKPHKTFAQWAEKYGPIYSIKAGSSTLVILNSNDVAKEDYLYREIKSVCGNEMVTEKKLSELPYLSAAGNAYILCGHWSISARV